MGSHTWFDQCPHCGFENMLVSAHNSIYFEVTCPICGYARWTEEKIPNTEDVELVKPIIGGMSKEQKENMVELYHEENVPLIARLKEKPPKEG